MGSLLEKLIAILSEHARQHALEATLIQITE